MIEFTKEELCERIAKLENDIEEKNEYIKKIRNRKQLNERNIRKTTNVHLWS